MLGFYNYTVVLTYIGMLSSFGGIYAAVSGELKTALLCLIFSGVCDMFDGKIASTMVRTRQEKNFGIQIDSLSDLVCFGVLPAVIVFMQNLGNKLSAVMAGGYLLCALIRLAYFNVDEAERQMQTGEARSEYLGLPVTSIALILPTFYALADSLAWLKPAHAAQLLVLVAILFLSPFSLKKPAFSGKAALVLCGAGELVLLMRSAL